MSEIKPDDPRGGLKHVEATVVGDEHDPAPPESETRALPDAPEAGTPSEPTPPFDTHISGADDLAAARYFSIAFLVVIVPLGLIILTMVTVAFVRSLDFLK